MRQLHACRASSSGRDKKGKDKQAKAAKAGAGTRTVLPFEVSIAGAILLGVMLVMYTCHCVWVSEAMYSAPSIVMQTRSADGSIKHFDDFREAYAWLRCAPHTTVCAGPLCAVTLAYTVRDGAADPGRRGARWLACTVVRLRYSGRGNSGLFDHVTLRC